mgnify:CR=1 FL=1
MKTDRPTDQELRRTFCDITQGFTSAPLRDKTVFIKHLGQVDQYLVEERREEIYEKAKAKGLPTNKEAIEVLIENDVWSEQEERDIVSNQDYLNNLLDTKKNLIIPSQISSINEDINKASEDLNKLKAKKSSLLTQTCETYANLKSNDFSVYLCLHKDKTTNEKFFSWDEFSELSKNEIRALLELYAQSSSHLDIEKVKYLSVSSIFSLYYNIIGSDNLHNFFRKPIYELTFYQLNLLNYARVLNSILENVDGIPEAIRQEPDDLLAYAESKRKNKNVVDRSKDKQGFSVMGATKKDMDEMGIADETTVSPFDLAGSKGSLTLEDFQNFE